MFTLEQQQEELTTLPTRHALADVDGVKAATIGVNVAGSVLSSAVGAGAISLGMSAAVAVPVIGVAVLGVTLALQAIFNRPTQKFKVYTTEIVNQLEPQLKANVQAYFDGPRTLESQAQALKNFDDAFAYLKSNQACGNPQLDFPGENCIKDRDRGGKWDWYAYYRDPIAQDTKPQEQAAAAAATPPDPLKTVIQAISPGSTPATVSNTEMYLIGAALLAALVIL